MTLRISTHIQQPHARTLERLLAKAPAAAMPPVWTIDSVGDEDGCCISGELRLSPSHGDTHTTVRDALVAWAETVGSTVDWHHRDATGEPAPQTVGTFDGRPIRIWTRA